MRESEPSRAVGGGSKNVVGAYPSKKMGKSLQFESHSLELAGLYLKEHDKLVLEMYDQPHTMKISYLSLSGKSISHYYTPDYFVIYVDKGVFEEWKTEDELCKLAKEKPGRYIKIDGVWHCPPGEEYARQFGLHFQIRSSSEINRIFLSNIVFLEDFFLHSKVELQGDTVEKIIDLVKKEPGILLINLLESFQENESDTIFFLIAREIIYVNIETDLLSEQNYTHVYINNAVVKRFCNTVA